MEHVTHHAGGLWTARQGLRALCFKGRIMGESMAEVGYLAGLCGWVSGAWEKLTADASHRLEVAVAAFTASVEVTQDTPGDLLVGSHHFDGTEWCKSNLLWGFNGRFAEAASDLNPAGGIAVLNFTAVPEGYVYVLQGVAAKNETRAATYLRIAVTGGGDTITVNDAPQTVAGHYDFVSTEITMVKDDLVSISFFGTTAGDDLYAQVWGYKMKIDM